MIKEHDVLVRIAETIQLQFPAESLKLLCAARQVKKMEECLDSLYEDAKVIALRPVREVIEPIVARAK